MSHPRRAFGWTAALAAAAALLAGGCATLAPAERIVPALASDVSAQTRSPVTILVSIDGFRSDYLDRGLTPTLSALAAGGVRAAMRPSFPSKTFPNHWAQVTGTVPDRHGIVANSFTDPARPDEKFVMATTDPFYWNRNEPIWVTAERAGIRTASMFWPGSAVAWGGTLAERGYGRVEGGIRPQDWTPFDQNVSPTQRVNTVIDWLRRPATIRPQFVTLYFDEVDTGGHDSGPGSAAVNQAIANVDRDIGLLLSGLADLGQPANIIVTSDHGMAETRSSRTIELDTILPRDAYQLVESGPYATLNPVPGREAEVAKALLVAHPQMQCWRKEGIPARLRYGTNSRIPAFLCLAQSGWQIFPTRREDPEDAPAGNHGYDIADPAMAAIFIANGPAFGEALTLPAFDNVDVNPLLRALHGLPQDPALDGRLAPVAAALRAAK